MPASNRDLVMFMALPYTDMGDGAGYKTKEGVIKYFIKPVKDQLAAKLGRKVELVVEEDYLEPGDVIASMFEHAWTADIYIADLTGANANVFLELGVRWALREQVTVIISQNDGPKKFNVSGARVVKYGPDTISDNIDSLVLTILNGLSSSKCDSLVLKNLPLITVEKIKYQEQIRTMDRLRQATGEDVIRTAHKQPQLSERIHILRKAVDNFPNSLAIVRELGISYKLDKAFAEAIHWLKKAIDIDPNDATTLRELGICYSKNGSHELAVDCLSKIKDLDEDFDALCSLGGALRRLAWGVYPNE
jgi:tetratricopeptide (TPR) repeat protein